MKLLRDFLCEGCGVEEERFLDAATTQTICPRCGNTMIRIIGMPTVALDGTDSGFPGAYEKWANKREQKSDIKRRKSYYEG